MLVLGAQRPGYNVGSRGLPIEIRDVDQENWFACTKLQVTDEQRALFPSPVVYWLAESRFVPHFTPLAIFLDAALIGFSVYGLDADDGNYWIIAFLIDRNYQGRGYGRMAMEALIQEIRMRHGCPRIMLGHRHANMHAERLYAALGFERVGEDEHEVYRCLTFVE